MGLSVLFVDRLSWWFSVKGTQRDTDRCFGKLNPHSSNYNQHKNVDKAFALTINASLGRTPGLALLVRTVHAYHTTLSFIGDSIQQRSQ